MGTTTSIPDGVLGATAVIATRPLGRFRRSIHFVGRRTQKLPFFSVILIFYLLSVALFHVDPYRVYHTPCRFSIGLLLLIFAALCVVWDLVQISMPGVKNTRQAFKMSLVAIAFGVLWIISLVLAVVNLLTDANLHQFQSFNTLEFVGLGLMSAAEAAAGFEINSNILSRAITNTPAVVDDHHHS